MNICIIPARGGSKRIPRKNIKLFAGKPMISYAIDVATASGMFDHVLVSTDDDTIIEIAQNYGAEILFKRPLELADDYTPTVPIIAHAIMECEKLDWVIDKVCCIYPCVPLIQNDDIESALLLLEQSDAAFSFPITEFPSAVQRALRCGEHGEVVPYYPEHELTRSQDLEPGYYDAGQFYWGAREAWLTINAIHSNGVAHIIPNWRVVDIDTPEDWQRAENIYEILNNRRFNEKTK